MWIERAAKRRLKHAVAARSVEKTRYNAISAIQKIAAEAMKREGIDSPIMSNTAFERVEKTIFAGYSFTRSEEPSLPLFADDYIEADEPIAGPPEDAPTIEFDLADAESASVPVATNSDLINDDDTETVNSTERQTKSSASTPIFFGED